jgi:hypothetical protein
LDLVDAEAFDVVADALGELPPGDVDTAIWAGVAG